MALKGTIQDFGVADILQLIGQQGKTGVLVFRNGPRRGAGVLPGRHRGGCNRS
jgi:hypothetical protein